MNSGLQKRLYEMEVTPPATVWEKLSVNLDEINADNLIGKKVLDAELTPPVSAWQNISIAINTEEKKEPVKRGVVINFKRFAAAAIVIGIIAVAWIIYQNNNQATTALTSTEENLVKPTSSNDTGSVIKKTDENNYIDSLIDLSMPDPQRSIASTDVIERINNKANHFRKNRNLAQTASVQYVALNNEKPGGNSFGQSIDDLSLITADQNYLTMVNANGRLVKIPAQFANLAPHLQNKPVSEDYYEVMFGEGAYWKETLNEWRKKVASLPVSSGDAFTSFIELLKTVQDK